MQRFVHRGSEVAILGAVTLLGLAIALLLLGFHPADIIKAAVGNPSASGDAQGAVGKINTAVDQLDSDALPFMAAVVPLAVVVGAGALFVGNRRGLTIIGSALGALVLVAAIKGIAA